MKYLLDTHLILWTVGKSANVPQKVKDIITNKDNTTYYSIISMWEVAIKRITHPDKITTFTPKELADFCRDAGIYELPLRMEHVCTLETLTHSEDAPPHKDPFDRILISQAKSEGMTFLTHDDLLPYYNEPCILYV